MNELITLAGIAVVGMLAAAAESAEPHLRVIGRQLRADLRSALGR